jgi:hypothetical protein
VHPASDRRHRRAARMRNAPAATTLRTIGSAVLSRTSPARTARSRATCAAVDTLEPPCCERSSTSRRSSRNTADHTSGSPPRCLGPLRPRTQSAPVVTVVCSRTAAAGEVVSAVSHLANRPVSGAALCSHSAVRCDGQTAPTFEVTDVCVLSIGLRSVPSVDPTPRLIRFEAPCRNGSSE